MFNGHSWVMLETVAVPQSPGAQPYRKFIARNGLEVQRHCHADTDVCLPLDGGWRDDEVVGVVAHQVNLKNAVGSLGRERARMVFYLQNPRAHESSGNAPLG